MRVESWESELWDTVEWARNEPYRIGAHDCVTFAAKVIKALTGKDHLGELTGKYDSERGALKFIRQLAGDKGLAGATSKILEQTELPMAKAGRGDLVMYRDDKDVEHLGICIGVDIAMLSSDGLLFINRGECVCCWLVE